MNGKASLGSAPVVYPTAIERHRVASTCIRQRLASRNGTTMMTQNQTRPGFFRLFLSGFALGAIALVSVQVAQPAQASSWDAPVQTAN